MNIPSNLKYTKDHEWVKVDGDVAVVGITDYAQDQLGDIVFVDIQTQGETLDKEEVFGTPSCLYPERSSRSTQLSRALPRQSTPIPTERAG